MKKTVAIVLTTIFIFIFLGLALVKTSLYFLSIIIIPIALMLSLGLTVGYLAEYYGSSKYGGDPIRVGILPSMFLITVLALPIIFGVTLALVGVYQGAELYIVAIISTGLTITLWNIIYTIPLALYHKSMEDKRKRAHYYPPLTVIVPAYNEEKVIARTIESIIEADYPNYKEIIVVDDGSKDRTYEIASRYKKEGVKVYRKENGGKHSAINYGLKFARGEIIVIVDADSILGWKALREIVKPFSDPEVSAVCGNIKVLNRVNWITKCQALEYISSINIFRRALDVFRTVMVVPGALGAFRKRVLENVGFYDGDTVTEDFDITLKILKEGRIVQASSEAAAYTEAPQTLRDFYKQRIRWYRGNFQNILLKHRDAFINPRYGSLQKLGFPYTVVSMIFVPFIGIVVWSAFIWALIKGYYFYLISILLLFIVIQTLLSLFAIIIDEEDPRLAVYSPFFVVGYRHLIDFITIKALFDVLFRKNITWTRVTRTGEIPKKI